MHFIDSAENAKLWEYAVLVTNADYPLVAMGQLYRDRADCENGFDELKNQSGWGGYTTHDIERCKLSARAVALIYNWWRWHVRPAHPKTRLEAIMHQARGVTACGQYACDQFFLANVALADVLNFNPRLGTGLMRPLTNPVTQGLGKLRVVKNTDALLVQKARHALRVARARQRTYDNDSIKTGQHPM
ncbi:MAG: hypothetical protein Q8P40_03595, partial [Nitrospirota bacterium]|nr:hypothetical protein [Nitrospirota bacterium]